MYSSLLECKTHTSFRHEQKTGNVKRFRSFIKFITKSFCFIFIICTTSRIEKSDISKCTKMFIKTVGKRYFWSEVKFGNRIEFPFPFRKNFRTGI